ncbi:MAG TPA: PPOX class F420-dependent oxidoreductase [Thermoleophilaceae bacterium]|nr:PPOX class F420-dependent oxidoreductase [Thermoleophilaceae bacterium]
MRSELDALRDTKTILLTTYRRDGTPVATPVSIAFDGEHAFFRTWHTAGKAKRLRRNAEVEVAPSTFRGEPTGEPIRARATLLDGANARSARRALARRHRMLQRLVVPVGHRLMRVRTLHYELTPRAS